MLAPVDPMEYLIHRYPAALIDRLTLADGRKVTVRPVLPQDFGLEQQFVRDLGQETRYRRFLMGSAELPVSVLESFTQVDYCNQLALIAETFDEDGHERQIADARYVVIPSDPAEGAVVAEFALVIDDAWQRQGLGMTLMTTLMGAARGNGVTRIEGDVLATNNGMLTLVRRLGFAVTRHPEEGRLRKVIREL